MSSAQNQQNVPRFDRWARSYERGRMSRWFTSGQARAIQVLGLGPDDWLLDVGCGTGWAVVHAAQRLPGGMACGIDLSPGMVARAQALAQGVHNVEFRVADAEAIPYPSGRFNAVICTNSFHHYAAPLKALQEMRRVLKPGGQLVILDSDRGRCLWVKLWDLFNSAFERGHVRYYTVTEVLQLLRGAGIRRAGVVETEHFHFRRGKIGYAVYAIRAFAPER